jgi:peptide deformylase
MATQIRTYGDAILRKTARPVARIDAETKQLVERMVEAMIRANGVGLAAPQVGVSKRIIVLDLDGQLRVLINPELVDASDETEEALEGCLSVPGVDAPITRRLRARVKGTSLDAETITLDGEGLMARAIQHELDHLNGILFLDHLSPARRRSLLREYAHKREDPD